MSLSPDQHHDRTHGIPASDIAAILGLHPHRSPLDVWLERTGKASPHAETVRTRWGELLEPVIRDEYATRRGVNVEQTSTQARVVHYAATPPQDGGSVTVYATPDGVVYVERGRATSVEGRGLEIKTHSIYSADYGREGSDEVPVHVAIQCQIGMFVTGLRAWDVIAFYDGEPHDYALVYDEVTANAAIEACVRWWRDHVVAHVRPEPDGSAATERAIRALLPGTWREPKAATWLTPDTEQRKALVALRITRRMAKLAAKEFARARQELELAIGDADGIEIPVDLGAEAGLDWLAPAKAERVSWRRASDQRRIDYQAALIDYHNRLALHLADIVVDPIGGAPPIKTRRLLDEIIAGPDYARYTMISPGARRFVVPRSWSKDLPGDEGDNDD